MQHGGLASKTSSTHSPYSNTYDDGIVRRANAEWRRDPERREAARARLAEISDAFEAAHAHLKQAVAAFSAAGVLNPHEDAIAERCQRALVSALVRFDRDAPTLTEAPNDTYLGNKAAFGYAQPRRPTLT